MEPICERIDAVEHRIRDAARQAGRDPDGVGLIGVSKTRPAEAIRAARGCGLRRFGESYLQEAVDKIRALADLDLEWHFIGRIQSNKTRAIAAHFDWVHSIDDLRHARRLDDQRPAELPPLNVCLQVNLAAEDTKGGLGEEQVAAAVEAVSVLPRLRLRGLMTLPPPATDPESQRLPFERLRRLRDRLTGPGLSLETLSMGMTDDLEAAVMEGSTLVRIGTAIFGPRS